MKNPMHRHRFLLLLLIASTLTFSALAQEASSWDISTRLLINSTTNRELISWAESNGGYYTLSSSMALELRIPVQHIDSLYDVFESNSAAILSYDISSYSIESEIRRLNAAISSRQETLERNRQFLSQSDVEGTLAIEREISQLIYEIEMYRGQLRVLLNDRAFARVHVQLAIPQPSVPGNQTSSFDWLRRINFYNFISGGDQ